MLTKSRKFTCRDRGIQWGHPTVECSLIVSKWRPSYHNGRQNGDLIDPLQVSCTDVPTPESREKRIQVRICATCEHKSFEHVTWLTVCLPAMLEHWPRWTQTQPGHLRLGNCVSVNSPLALCVTAHCAVYPSRWWCGPTGSSCQRGRPWRWGCVGTTPPPGSSNDWSPGNTGRK